MINFRKHGLKHQKPQFEKCRKYPMKCMKNAWKHQIKCKRKGKKDLPALGEKNLAKISEENDKKSLVEPSQVGERERKVWNSPIWLFKKLRFDLFKLLFQNFFKLSSLSLRLGKAPLRIFCRFRPIFLHGFSLPRPVRPLYPSFCIYFHVFMHKFMHFCGIFRTFQYWDFCWINPLFLKLIIGFCSYIGIFMIYDG